MIGFSCLAGGVAAVALFVLRQPSEVTVATEVAPRASKPLEAVPENSPLDPKLVTRVQEKPTTPSADRFRFSPGQDAMAFVEGLLPEAHAGNREAQYAIYEALFYCDDTYKLYFERRTRRLTLDEALAQAARLPGVNIKEMRASHATCNALKSADAGRYGSARDWLRKSSDLGLPMAQGRNASTTLTEDMLTRFPAGASARPSDEELAARNAAASRLMLTALNSRDPAVTWELANTLNLFTGHLADDNGDMWVWRLAACKQGYDCSATARWKSAECFLDANCFEGESGIDYIRRNSAKLRPNVDSLADQLLARLNQGDIDMTEFESLIRK